MYLVDTHCHLNLLDKPAEKYHAARSNHIGKIVIPSLNATSIRPIKTLCQAHNNLYYAVGIYPSYASEYSPSEMLRQCRLIENHLQIFDSKLIAIGECGLDFKDCDREDGKDDFASIKKRQEDLLLQHISWSQTYDLPLLIHNRGANQALLSLLTRYPKLKGVLHCFAGSKKYANQVLEQTNFLIGIGGLLTTDTGLAEVVKSIPIERIVLETDAPYIVPKQTRHLSDTNEPAFLSFVAQKLGQIKGIAVEQVSAITTANAQSLFPQLTDQ